MGIVTRASRRSCGNGRTCGLADTWHDGSIVPGDELSPEIERNLRNSTVILFLVSPDFIASKYCMETEVRIAMDLHNVGKARCIPIILRPCNWLNESFGKILALPKDGKAITTWSDQDEAMLDAINGIKEALKSMG